MNSPLFWQIRTLWLVLAGPVLFGLPARAQDAVSEEVSPTGEVWDAADTAIANHYISSLQQQPEYGKVLELLWEHYEKHDQLGLLVEFFESAASSEGATIPQLITGHLWRKKGNADKAFEYYRKVEAAAPDYMPGIRALAELYRQENQLEDAATAWQRLIELEGTSQPNWIESRLIHADVLRELDRTEEAVQVWMTALDDAPQDLGLRQRVVALLLEEGRTREAIESYSVLAHQGEPVDRAAALKELGRLHEFIDDFDNAVAVYREALSLVHFKHFLHDEFLTRLVRVHERFGRIDELEAEWLEPADQENPSEEALTRMVKFYELTADSRQQQAWLQQLVERTSASMAYEQQLVELLIENDEYEEAARRLEEMTGGQKSIPVNLLTLQARVTMTVEGLDAAEQLLADHLDTYRLPKSSLQQILRFARENYLDGIAERLLRDQRENGWAEEGEIPELKLAAFHHERGRRAQAVETVRDWIDAAVGDEDYQARLLLASRALRELQLPEIAAAAAEEAVEEGLAGRAHYLALAEALVDQKRTRDAIAEFERVLDLSEGLEARTEVDQRIFSVLRAAVPEQEEAPDPARQRNIPAPQDASYDAWAWAELWEYYKAIKETAEADPTLEHQFRAGWWALRLQQTREAYLFLGAIENSSEEPILIVAETMLDLAELTGNWIKIQRSLEQIATIDPDREEEALIRKALISLEMNFEDRAIRSLEALVNRPDSSLKAVQALAQAYQDMNMLQKLEELWARTFAKANILEKRQILKPWTNTLLELEKVEEALEVQIRMIEAETDLDQRRRILEDQLTFAARNYLLDPWLSERYAKLARQYPLDRFYPEATARVHRAAGKPDEAFQSMKRAYYMSNGDPGLLAELGNLASQTSDLDAAIYYQRQLIAQEEDSASADDWLSLIERLEEDLRVDEADLTRRRLESKFGQDPDFLAQLVRDWLRTGRTSEARRILERIVTLRPWDARSLMELGLIALEEGDEEEAIEVFEQLLAETQETAPAADAEVAQLPIYRTSPERPEPGQTRNLGLEEYALAVEDFPFLRDDRAEFLSEWFRKAKPAFQRVPADTHDLRLRAIEELAHLKQGDRDWITHWSTAPEISNTERLWALIHSGGKAAARALLEDLIRERASSSQPGPWDLLYAMACLQNGDVAPLVEWTTEDGIRHGVTLAAISLTMREMDVPDPELRELFAGIGVRTTTAQAIMQSLRVEGHWGKAFQVGEAAAEVCDIDDYMFHVNLFTVAERLGLEERRQHWVQSAFDHLELDRGVPFYSFYRTIRETWRLEGNAGRQEEIIAHIEGLVEALPEWQSANRYEALLWLAVAVGDTDLALVRAGELAASQRELRKGYRAAFTEDHDANIAINQWIQLETLLNLLGERIPDREELDELARAILPDDFLPAVTRNEVDAQYQQFRMIQLLWELETVSPPVRARLISQYLGTVNTAEEYLELARSLESRGMAPASLPIYARLLDHSAQDSTILRGFLGACRQARAWDEAIHVLEDYLSHRKAWPESMTDEYLHRNYANFLYLADRKDELATRSQNTERPIPLRSFYRHYLITWYLDHDDSEAAIRVYQSLLREGSLSRSERIRLAELLIDADRLEEARPLMDAFTLSAGDTNDIPVLEVLGRLQAAADPPDLDALTTLARRSLNYPSPELSRKLAALLVEAGQPETGHAILTLRARAATDEASRFHILMEHLRLGLSHPELRPDREELLLLLRSWNGDALTGRKLLELLREFEKPDPVWSEVVAETRDESRSRGLALAVGVTLELVSPAEVRAELDELREDKSGAALQLLAGALTATGKARLAMDVLAVRHAQHVGHPLEDLEVMLPALQAIGDERAILDWGRRAIRLEDSHTRMAEIARAFAEAGETEIAAAIFDAHHARLKVLSVDDQFFLTQYANFLIDQEDFRKAEQVLQEMLHKSIGGDPSMVIDLYGAWGRLDDLDQQVKKFHLPDPVLTAIREAREDWPHHRDSAKKDENFDDGGYSPWLWDTPRPRVTR